MKKTLRTLCIVFIGLIVLVYFLPATLVRFPFVQKAIADGVTSFLENKIGTKVEIEKIELRYFYKLGLKNVYLEDQDGESLASIGRVDAGFYFLPLLNKQVRIHSAQLYSLDLQLRKKSKDSPLNIQYIIDAFASDTGNEQSPIDLQIKTLRINTGSISYDVKDQDYREGIDFNHIALEDISGKIKLHKLKNGAIDASLEKLRLKEKSGFQIKQLSFSIEADKDSLAIDQFLLKLPESHLTIENIRADYSQGEDKWKDMTIRLSIEPSELEVHDFVAFSPELLSDYKNKVRLTAQINGRANDFTIENMAFSEKNKSVIEGKVQILNLLDPDKKKIYLDTSIPKVLITEKFLQYLDIPEEAKRLGDIQIKGKAKGFVNDMRADIEINTNAGDLDINASFKENGNYAVAGNILSSGIHLGSILGNNDLGEIVFDINVDSKFQNEKDFRINLLGDISSVEYQQTVYDGIRIEGELMPDFYEGLIRMDGKKGHLTAEGSALLKGYLSDYQLQIEAEKLNLGSLKFITGYDDFILSLSSNIHFQGNNLDNVTGNLHVNNLSIDADNKPFLLNSLELNISRLEKEKNITILSDILDMDIVGQFSTQALIPRLKQTIYPYLPSLLAGERKELTGNDCIFSFQANLGETDDLFSLLNLPVRVDRQTKFDGYYNSPDNQLYAHVFSSQLKFGNKLIDSCSLVLDNQQQEIALNLKGKTYQKKNDLYINAGLIAKNDSIYSAISWEAIGKGQYNGLLDFTTHLSTKPRLQGDVYFNETQMIFNDSIWKIHPAEIHFDGNNIEVNHLWLAHEDQFVQINGIVSNNPEDQLVVNLKSIDLEYLFDILNIPALEFGGYASGVVYANDVYLTRQLNTQLFVSDFTFNKTLFGDLNLKGIWEDTEQGVKMLGHVAENDSTYVGIEGMIYPVKEILDLNFYPKNADVSFIRKYVNNVVKDFSGRGSGEICLFGHWNDPTLKGEAYIHNGRFGIEFLNTYYSFSDTIRFAPDRFEIKNMKVFDEHGNSGYASGWAKHNLLKDFTYQADLNFQNFLLFNSTEKKNPTFYGQIFGTGSGMIKGTEDEIDISANIQNTDDTKITLNFMDQPEVTEHKFLSFVDKSMNDDAGYDKSKGESNKLSPNNDSGMEMNLNFKLVINEDAYIEAIMDPRSGDKISGRGKGTLDVHYGTENPLRIFGKYAITDGKYDFSLEQLYFLHFNIHEESSISFKGDPFAAELDVKAAHTVQASLADLSTQLLDYSTRSKVPVDCVIHLSGALEQPEISFDIELPGATSDLERQVKSYIRTEEMLNRQMLYLLVLNRFYTPPEFSDSDRNNDYSLLASTLSTQLSNLLGSLSDKVQVGTQFHHSNEGDYTSTEVELMLSSSFVDNRLIVYGNFGYIDNPYINDNSAPLVGDFDVEYKLTKNGDIRLKGFNHYNYRYYYSQTPQWTQGVGVVFRKDFDHFMDIFRRKKKTEQPAVNE